MIRHIACPIHGNDLFATAFATTWVTIWSLQRRCVVSHFRTVLDDVVTGGMALVGSDPPTVVTTSSRMGLCGYDALTGELIWRQKSRRSHGVMKPLPDDESVAIGHPRKPMVVVSAVTGEFNEYWRGEFYVYPSPYAPLVLHAKHYGDKCMLSDFPKDIRRWKTWLHEESFPAALGPDAILLRQTRYDPKRFERGFDLQRIAESYSQRLRCIDLQGKHLWDWHQSTGRYIANMIWAEASQTWLCLDRSTDARGASSLLQLDRHGRLLDRFALQGYVVHDLHSLTNGRFLISHDGRVLSLPDGEIVWSFADDPGPRRLFQSSAVGPPY